MRNPSRSEPQSPATMLLRRLAVVFLVGLTGGVALSFIGLANRTIAPAAFELASSSCLGLLSGFASRRALRSHTPALRGLASLAAVIVGMLFVGWVSGGEAGLVIHHLSPAATDWSGLIHLAMAAASATLALYAWSSAQVRRITDAAPPTTVAPARSDGRSISRPRRAPPRASAPGVGRSRLAGIASRAEEPMQALLRRFSAWRASLQTIRLPGRLPTWDLPRRVTRPRGATHGVRVRLLGAEEHRCPYCLDVVERADRRGVVTCKVCHTRHHADCWAVTGMCQVPHLHK